MVEYAHRLSPYDHQRVMFEHMRILPHSMVLCEQGTGKTKGLIDYLDWRAEQKGGLEHILLVVPVSIIFSVWVREIMAHSRMYDEAYHILRGPPKKRKQLVSRFPKGLYVTNYEVVRSMRGSCNLARLNWDVVAADETTKIKKHSSQRSAAMHDFPKMCPRAKRIGLCGLAVTNSPLDVFSQYLYVDPVVFGSRWYQFMHRYAEVVRRKYGNGPSFNEIVGFQNLDELTEKMHSIAVRYRKDECLDLPEKNYQVRIVSWKKGKPGLPSARSLYDQMRKEFMAEMDSDNPITVGNALAKAAKLRQMCSGFIYDENRNPRWIEGGDAKLDELDDVLEQTSGQITIFCTFRADIAAVTAHLKKKSISHSVVTGGMSDEEFANQIDDFKTGVTRVFVAMTQVVSHGVTLVNCQTVIYYSQSWSVEERVQSEDRFHRIGQKNAVTYIDLAMEKSADLAVSKSVRNGVNVSQACMNNAKESLAKIMNGEKLT